MSKKKAQQLIKAIARARIYFVTFLVCRNILEILLIIYLPECMRACKQITKGTEIEISDKTLLFII